jgi:hypothetical protein
MVSHVEDSFTCRPRCLALEATLRNQNGRNHNPRKCRGCTPDLRAPSQIFGLEVVVVGREPAEDVGGEAGIFPSSYEFTDLVRQ